LGEDPPVPYAPPELAVPNDPPVELSLDPPAPDALGDPEDPGIPPLLLEPPAEEPPCPASNAGLGLDGPAGPTNSAGSGFPSAQVESKTHKETSRVVATIAAKDIARLCMMPFLMRLHVMRGALTF